ncbi:MAG: AsmA family protein, partial [Kiloniellaceae bacterium]
MKKRRGRLRRLLTLVTALVVAVLVAAYAMISSLDVQQLAGLAKREVKAATGRDLAVDGPVSLRVSLVPSIDLQDLRLANAPWGSRPDMATLEHLEVEVALLPLLWGEVVVKRLVVVEPDILLETDAEGRGNWEFETAASTSTPGPETAPAGEEADAVTVPDVQAFRIEGGQLTVRDAASGEVLQLAVGQVVGSVPAGGGQRNFLFEAAYNGNPFSVEGSYPGLAALLSGASAPLDLTLTAGGATVTAKGQAGDLTGDWTAELAVTAEGENLAGLSPFAGSALPPLGPFKLTSEIKGAKQTIEFNGLRLVVGGSDLAGNATLSLAGERPALKAALVSKLFDLADVTGNTGNGDGASGGDPARVFSDTPLPLEALRAADAEVKLSVERLRIAGITLEAVEAPLVLKGGTLTVDPFAGRLAGGPVGGRLAVAAGEAEPRVALTLKGQDIDFGDLLRQAEVSDEVGGALALDIDLKGRGASPHAIAAGLGGHLQAVSQDGTLDNNLLRFFSIGLGDITGPLFGGSDRTRLECFVTRFDIEKGQARSRALVLDSGAFAMAGR